MREKQVLLGIATYTGSPIWKSMYLYYNEYTICNTTSNESITVRQNSMHCVGEEHELQGRNKYNDPVFGKHHIPVSHFK